MKKEEQKKINEQCEKEFANALKEYAACGYDIFTPSRRLRSCSATVYDTTNYYILKSYDTFVACINKNTDTLYDVLRVVYGYTATSCKHISKFAHDYKAPSSKWTVSHAMVAR